MELIPDGNREQYLVVTLSDRHCVLGILTKFIPVFQILSWRNHFPTEQLFAYLIRNVYNYSYFIMYITVINIYMETENENIGLKLKRPSEHAILSLLYGYIYTYNFKHILLLIHSQKFKVWSLSM